MNTNLLKCLEFIAKEQGITISDEVFRTIPEDDNIDSFLSNAANYIGFECESLTIKKIDIDNISPPAISLYQNQPVIVHELDESVAYISSPNESDNKQCIPTDDFYHKVVVVFGSFKKHTNIVKQIKINILKAGNLGYLNLLKMTLVSI